MSDRMDALPPSDPDTARQPLDAPDAARRALESSVVAPLTHLGLLDIAGPDAERFLQGQTSAQLTLANGDFAPLTCFCTPKGRMLANGQLLRIDAQRYRLLLHRELIAPLVAHLTKFAAFYKVSLEPRDDLTLLGLTGAEATALAEVRLDITPPALWHQAGDATTLLLAHPGPRPRVVICTPTERAEAVLARLTPQATRVDAAVWRLHDIQAGLYWLTPHHQDALLPQMINWEALGGISFKKGCYTGQEVVARAHFRGQVKRRLYRAQLEGDRLPAVGSAVTDAEAKSHGEVLAAELDAYGQAEVLAVLSTKEEIGPLAVEGQALKRLKLPYAVERVDPESLTSRA